MFGITFAIAFQKTLGLVEFVLISSRRVNKNCWFDTPFLASFVHMSCFATALLNLFPYQSWSRRVSTAPTAENSTPKMAQGQTSLPDVRRCPKTPAHTHVERKVSITTLDIRHSAVSSSAWIFDMWKNNATRQPRRKDAPDLGGCFSIGVVSWVNFRHQVSAWMTLILVCFLNRWQVQKASSSYGFPPVVVDWWFTHWHYPVVSGNCSIGGVVKKLLYINMIFLTRFF